MQGIGASSPRSPIGILADARALQNVHAPRMIVDALRRLGKVLRG